MEQNLSIMFCVPSVNRASGLLPFMCDISLWCLEGTQASTSIHTGEKSPRLSPSEET